MIFLKQIKNRVLAIPLILTILLSGACSYQVDTLIPGEEMAATENGVFTRDGRFFVAAESYIYEVIETSAGFEKVIRVTGEINGEPCTFNGLTNRGNILFGACMNSTGLLDPESNSVLMRIDLSRHETSERIKSAPLGGGYNFFPNGMDFDRNGVLYISNSLALLGADAAILRVDILNEDNLVLNVSDWLSASSLALCGDFGDGGLFPNGVRIAPAYGNPALDTMYFARGFSVAKMDIIDGTHGEPRIIYQTDGIKIVDDIDVHDNYLGMAEANLPGLLNPDLIESKVVVIKAGGPDEGEHVESVNLDFLPSSVAYGEHTIFGEKALLVTSFFNGGVYRITEK